MKGENIIHTLEKGPANLQSPLKPKPVKSKVRSRTNKKLMRVDSWTPSISIYCYSLNKCAIWVYSSNCVHRWTCLSCTRGKFPLYFVNMRAGIEGVTPRGIPHSGQCRGQGSGGWCPGTWTTQSWSLSPAGCSWGGDRHTIIQCYDCGTRNFFG